MTSWRVAGTSRGVVSLEPCPAPGGENNSLVTGNHPATVRHLVSRRPLICQLHDYIILQNVLILLISCSSKPPNELTPSNESLQDIFIFTSCKPFRLPGDCSTFIFYLYSWPNIYTLFLSRGVFYDLNEFGESKIKRWLFLRFNKRSPSAGVSVQ